MATETLTKEAVRAAQYFEDKLNFEISPWGVKAAIEAKQPQQIIDLRTPELFAKGHIPGAINVLYENLDQYASKLNKDIVTVVYCYDLLCNLAAKAALLLANKGYKVKELAGGIEEWTKRDFATEPGAKTGSCSTSGHACG
jgi:rhodanese-related sulfurtransferase